MSSYTSIKLAKPDKILNDYLLRSFAPTKNTIEPPPLPYCSEPDDRWPPQINACLREILRYRQQQLDPEGYRKSLITGKGKQTKGSAEGGRKE